MMISKEPKTLITDICSDMLASTYRGEFHEEYSEQICSIVEAAPVLKDYARETLLTYIGQSVFSDIWLYSTILAFDKSNHEIFEQFLCRLLDNHSSNLDWQNYYFLFHQMNSIMFQNPDLNTSHNLIILWKLLRKAFDECKSCLEAPLERIPREDRNDELALVLTEQFLSGAHGPTKTALDRCIVLQNVKKKKVLLINTAELLTTVGYVPFFNAEAANYIESLTNAPEVIWKNLHFPYYQCEHNMPNLREIKNLVAAVKEMKPSIIVQIGGSSLVAGILNELIPVMTVGTLLSRFSATLSEYQIIPKNLMEQSDFFLHEMNLPNTHIIQGRFTYSLKTQTEHITRKMLGLAEDKFAIAIVGVRLDNEITDEFLDMLTNCVDDTMQIGIIGICDTFHEKIQHHPALKNKVLYLGFCRDILSRMEQFDLYVNPVRRGGGGSAVEAMIKGIPVVSTNYGDVAEVVGSEFCCDNYDEMQQLIQKYKTDSDFYIAQSQKAKALADLYLNSDDEFSHIIDEYYMRQS